jgi:hypothetical protein
MRYLSRDSFARITYYRESVHVEEFNHSTCKWCGNPGKSIVNNERVLYRYGYEKDGIYTRVQFDNGLFCCKSCHDDYHNQ